MKLGADRIVVRRERRRRRRATLQRRERGLGRETARLDRVVHALEPRDVDEPDAVAAQEEPGRVQPRRQRVEAAARDRLRAPRDALAALEQLANLRMRLQLLQQVVRRELDVAVVEPDHHPDGEHVVAHRVDERAAELAVLRRRSQRPAHRVDDAVELARNLPDLFHAELPDLRLVAPQPEVVERDAGEMALRPFREDGHLRDEVRAGLVVAERLAVTTAPLVAGAHADDAAVRDEQLLRRRLGKDRRSALLGTLAEPAAETREREHPVAVVAHRRRRRDAQRVATRQDVHRLACTGPYDGRSSMRKPSCAARAG